MKTLKLITLFVCSLSLMAQYVEGTPAIAAGQTGTNRWAVSLPSYFELTISHQQLAGRAAIGNPVGQMEGRNPEEIWRQIKSLAEAEAASTSSSFVRPSLTIKLVGSTTQLTIKKGSVGDLGFGNDPYGTPFRKQLLIEALRRALTEGHLEDAAKQTGTVGNSSSSESSAISEKNTPTSNNNEQWRCYLDQAEQLVRQTVVAIETITNKDQLKQLLQKSEDQIDDLLYNQLVASVQKYAEHNRYNVIFDRGSDTVKPFSVSFNSVPDGAKVWLMTDLVYRKQLITKADPSQWPWREMVQNPADLIGKYRYMLRWPDGRHAEGNIEVSNASSLKFLPQ